jgi:hypothetical protein
MSGATPFMSKSYTERRYPSQMSKFGKAMLNVCIDNKDQHNTICLLGKMLLNNVCQLNYCK